MKTFQAGQLTHFGHDNIKKTDLKSSIPMSFGFFFLSAAPTAQNSPELNIHIRNVAQDTFVDYIIFVTNQLQLTIGRKILVF
jgi:hypothetical protein